jgi:hypothetical protein
MVRLLDGQIIGDESAPVAAAEPVAAGTAS